ncbi:hypothetical protein CPT03_06015 [Pedobacter ginsengisoli]|uniref:Uncharacterized protein n=1 Tax=Pedobacter ginsengisoli TaxID=363852 RepID=A0A2D1U3F7_9SPHI|nr:hypothetical protein [Pedobacter ginsengisoli]ATP56044.1 hypothetical protein CPT03_06015 [Pedobacter ginsengisoli]
MPTLKKILSQKTDQQLMYYVNNPNKHTDEAVDLALVELRSRGVELPENINQVITEKKAAFEKQKRRNKFYFSGITVAFCIVGGMFSIGAAIAVMAYHEILKSLLGIDCMYSWYFMWFSTGVFSIGLPLFFFRYFQSMKPESMTYLLGFFFMYSVVEIICLQVFFLMFTADLTSMCEANSHILPTNNWGLLLAYVVLIMISVVFERSDVNIKSEE